MLSRRDFLSQFGGGMGALACASLLQEQTAADDVPAKFNGGLHHPAKVRRVIHLFMNGGASPMDTFDYKPELAKQHGKEISFGLQTAVTSKPGAIMKSPFDFKQHGESGRWVSSVFPNVAKHVDDLAFLMSMQSKTNVHGPASYMQNTGFLTGGYPSMGAWISYGLGRLTDELPTFVVLPDHRGFPYNNTGNFSSAFLPAEHGATIVKPNAPMPIANLHPPANASFVTRDSEVAGLKLMNQLNEHHLDRHQGDSRLDARIASFELAARMQLSAPEALDTSRETSTTQSAYGLDQDATKHFGRSCLVARRLIERDVRFVQVWSGAGGTEQQLG